MKYKIGFWILRHKQHECTTHFIKYELELVHSYASHALASALVQHNFRVTESKYNREQEFR